MFRSSLLLSIVAVLTTSCAMEMAAPSAHGTSATAGKADGRDCPEEVADTLLECASESWSEVPEIGGIISGVDYCFGDPDALADLYDYACDDGDCDYTVQELIEEVAPACRKQHTPIFGVYLELREAGEYIDPDDEQYRHWWADGDGGYTYQEKDYTYALDFSDDAGGFDVRVTPNGQASLSYSYGDADGTTRSKLSLPWSEREGLTAAAGIYELEVSGGDHASGAWQAEGKLIIEIAR